MDGTAAALEGRSAAGQKPGATDGSGSAVKCDLKELRSVLRAVRKATQGDGSSLWQPVRPGGPNRYDHYQHVLFNAFKAQMPGSIRRLKASKPIAVRTRKIVAAMLALGRFDPEKTAG
jgi:hypothetical protein